MACFGLIGANAGALAMGPDLGPIAGTASSLQGLVTTIGGALIGYHDRPAVRRHVTVPMIGGFAICGALALAHRDLGQ